MTGVWIPPQGYIKTAEQQTTEPQVASFTLLTRASWKQTISVYIFNNFFFLFVFFIAFLENMP